MITKQYSIKDRVKSASVAGSSKNFYEYLELLKSRIKDVGADDARYDNLSFRALTGDPEAVSFFLSEINKYVSMHPFSGAIPAAYDDVSEAIFHEWIGFGPAYKWFTDKRYASSPGLQIIGREIFINVEGKGYRLYPHKMASLDQVERLKRVLTSNDKYMQLDHANPTGELKMDDPLWPEKHLRLAIWVEPRVWGDFTTITARRQVLDFMTLDAQAGTGSIPLEAVDMMRALFRTYNNTIVAGSVGSGKSTFANTVVGEQLLAADRCMGVVMIEKHPESTIPYVFRDQHRIIPVIADDETVMDIGIESLRHDLDILYLTEMRHHEWSLYLFSSEKGHKGLIGTYHTLDPEEIPFQAATSYLAEVGGSFKAHLLTALRACELTIIMRSTKDGGKRLDSISEIVYDPETSAILSNAIMKWDEATDTWSYNDKVSERTLRNMAAVDREATKQFLEELELLASVNRIADPIKVSVRSQNELKK